MAKRKSDGAFCIEKCFSVTTGVTQENYSILWRIQNFVKVKSSVDVVRAQIFSFETGKPDGQSTKWRCSLHTASAKPNPAKNIEIFLVLGKAPESFQTTVNYTAQMIKPNGELVKLDTVSGGQTFSYHNCYNLPLCKLPENVNELIWEDGSIVNKLDFELLNWNPVLMTKQVSVDEEIKIFEKRELKELSQRMTRKLEGGPQEVGNIIKVVAKDEAEFFVNCATLSARSPVFQAMFDSGRWREGQSSEGGDGRGSSLVLGELAGKTVKVLMHYLCGGVLLKEEWKAEDVILELTSAAHMYQLDGLSEFLDKVLPGLTFTSTQVLAELTLLTEQLGMKNAEKGLYAKLKETETDIDQLLAAYQ